MRRVAPEDYAIGHSGMKKGMATIFRAEFDKYGLTFRIK
jgi:hypothetical protein